MASRRTFLQATVAVAAATALPAAASAQKTLAIELKEQLLKYLESNAKSDGSYGWDGQDHSHLTPTFAVIGCYRLLGIEPPNKAALARFVRTHHPRELKKLEREQRHFDWQQIQSLVWLNEDVSSFRDLVTSWKEPKPYSKQYEQHGYPVFQQEIAPILCRKLLGLPMAETPAAFIDYVNSRRRTNGSFNSTPADDKSDGHVLNTWWGLQALAVIDPQFESLAATKVETIAWLRACQLPLGGFTYQPVPQPSAEDLELQKRQAREPKLTGKAYLAISLAGRSTEPFRADDIAYTWAAVRSLKLLGAEVKIVNTSFAEGQPSDPLAEYLRSIHNDDGGFGDRPGWLSNPLATYYALDTLSALGFINNLPVPKPQSPIFPLRAPLLANLKVFSLQLEAHGQGSPADAVELADSLGIHLWGAKNAKPEWIARAQQLASQQGVAVKFFLANEGYGTWIDIPGLGNYSHMCDSFAPVGNRAAPSLAGEKNLTWAQFSPGLASRLQAAGGHLFWQFGENEPLVRLLLDDSIRATNLQNDGYAAISTFHFSNPDFTNTEPFLMRYRGQIPFVALQDAHGPEPWWFADMTTGFRTLFLAEKPNWVGWLDALRFNRVVAVRHDAVSGGKTWMHGLPHVIEVAREQWQSWQWWDNPSIERPLVSLVAVNPQDEFETGRPERGVAIRVRCARENTTQGVPKNPLAEFVRLRVAGQIVEPQLIERRRPNGVLEDAYHLYNWPDAPKGKHTATVTFRRPNSTTESSRFISFTV